MKKTIILLTLILLSASAFAQEFPPEKLEKLETELENLCKQFSLPGMSAAVVKDGKLIWAKGFGYADMEKKIPAAPDTPYRIASLSKPFAAVLAMQEIEKEKLSLNSLLSDFPQVAKELKNKGIMLRHILSHTSHDLGKSFRYSGFSYDQARQVLEQVTGKSYHQLLKERFFYPLEMKNSSTGETTGEFDSVNQRLAKPYKYTPEKGLFPGQYVDFKASAAAGIISSVTDLAKFDAALDKGSLVDQYSMELMLTPTKTPDGKVLPYGMGFFIEKYQGRQIYWHYGFWECSSSLYVKIPELGISYFLLSNSENLSRTFMLSDGTLVGSPFARALLSLL